MLLPVSVLCDLYELSLMLLTVSRSDQCVTVPSMVMLQLTYYDAKEDGVTLHFDGDQPPVHTKLLIGADGYFSKVRKQCLNDGPPQFAVGPLNLLLHALLVSTTVHLEYTATPIMM